MLQTHGEIVEDACIRMISAQLNRSRQYPIAPVWHTCCLLAIVAVLSGLSAYLKVGSHNPEHGHLPLYTIVLFSEWAELGFCLWRSDKAFVSDVARAVHDPRALLLDIPAALILSAFCYAVVLGLVRILGPSGWGSVAGILPSNNLEVAAWIVMAMSAGICEEVVFRGYLQQQFSGWTGRPSIGISGQAAIFALAHGYQGSKSMTLIFALGCIYGAFVPLRKGLRANMIAHAGMDILSAFGG